MLSSLRASAEVFEPTPTAKLPLPVRMWLQHSIRAGTPLARTAWLRMRGHIRIRAWRPFVATQVLAPGVGFIWAATAKVAGTPVLGYDKYVDGVGEMRWGIGGLVPVMSARDTNISISAAGRLAAELCSCQRRSLAPRGAVMTQAHTQCGRSTPSGDRGPRHR